MSARLFAEWQAYFSIEPFGPPAAFWRTGMAASIMANVNRTKKSQRAFQPEDFMPESMKPEPPECDEADEAEALKARFLAYGEQAKRRG
jgi:hypothetical protein